ncbi:MAG: XdhC family protein [Chthoniobacterales bacterium]
MCRPFWQAILRFPTRRSDNSKVVPTDTIKNTVNVFAKQHLAEDLERFAAFVGEHFVRRHEQVSQATIEITERASNRPEVDGKPHPHTFAAGSEARRFARAFCTADASELSAGVRDLVILKSTGSGFEGSPKYEYTTLPETADRILATSFRANWHFPGLPNGRSVSSAINDDGRVLRRSGRRAAGAKPCALVTVVAMKGFVPREAGAKMLVYLDDLTSGTIGGEKFEALAVADALLCFVKSAPYSRPSRCAKTTQIPGSTRRSGSISGQTPPPRSRLACWPKFWRAREKGVLKVCANESLR